MLHLALCAFYYFTLRFAFCALRDHLLYCNVPVRSQMFATSGLTTAWIVDILAWNIMLPTKYDVALPNRQKVDHVCPKPIARMMLNDTCFRASLIWITLVGTHVQAKARALSSSPWEVKYPLSMLHSKFLSRTKNILIHASKGYVSSLVKSAA